jgi:hypothetical protein
MYVRRAHLVLATALAALALAPSGAAAASQAGASSGANRWAVLVGFEDFGGDAGLQLRGDLEFAQRPLAPAVGFSIVGSLAYSHWGDSHGYDPYYGRGWKWSANLVKGVAAARFSFGRSTVVRPYADAGLGLYWAGTSGTSGYAYDPYYGGWYAVDYSDSSVGFLLRLAAGVQFNVSPGFALGVELGVHPYLGDFPNDTSTSLMASATFRM